MSDSLTNDIAHGEGSGSYGQYFWMVGVPGGRQIAIHADAIEVDANGALHAMVHSKQPDEKTGEVRTYAGFGLSAGHWEYYYAASVLDGTAIAVDRVHSEE